jgi:hypothetical protein
MGHLAVRPEAFSSSRSVRSAERLEPLLERLDALLDLQPDDLLVQLGTAWPRCTLALADLVPLRYQILVVDPAPERLEPFVGTAKLRVAAMDALDFCAFPIQYDRILLEDTFLAGDGWWELVSQLLDRLNDGGRLLIVESEVPVTARMEQVARALERDGLEVKRDGANVGKRHVDLVLASKGDAPAP